MTNRKATKRALLASVLALLLCVSMLIGSTFAWFTDTAVSGENKIVAGNLDVALQHKAGDSYAEVDENTKLFLGADGKQILWEPGVVACETFKVTNEGTLALKYFLSMAVSKVNSVVTADGDTGLTLLDVLKVAVVEGETSTDDRAEAMENASFTSIHDFGGKGGKLKPQDAEEKEGFTEEDIFTVLLYWAPTQNDNDYNLSNVKVASDAEENTVGALSIDLTVNLVATQVPYEADSFGEDYDADAYFPRLGTSVVMENALFSALNNIYPDDRDIKWGVKSITFADYDETLHGAWEDGVPTGATEIDEVRMFVKENTPKKDIDVYICVKPGAKIMLNEDSSKLFNEFQAVERIDFGPKGLVSTENVTKMDDMFMKCSTLTSLDLSGWDVSNVKSMSAMFHSCRSLENLDLTGWDVSNVTDMSQMFKICPALANIDLADWNVSNVTSMSQMFQECSALTALDLSAWDVSKVTIMSNMFSGCKSLTELDLSGWNVLKLKKVDAMFNGCSALETIYASDWNNAFTSDKNMFLGCEKLPGYDASNVSSAYAKTTENGGYFTQKTA